MAKLYEYDLGVGNTANELKMYNLKNILNESEVNKLSARATT